MGARKIGCRKVAANPYQGKREGRNAHPYSSTNALRHIVAVLRPESESPEYRASKPSGSAQRRLGEPSAMGAQDGSFEAERPE